MRRDRVHWPNVLCSRHMLRVQPIRALLLLVVIRDYAIEIHMADLSIGMIGSTPNVSDEGQDPPVDFHETSKSPDAARANYAVTERRRGLVGVCGGYSEATTVYSI